MADELGSGGCLAANKPYITRGVEIVKRNYGKVLTISLLAVVLSSSLVLIGQNTAEFRKSEKVGVARYEKTSSVEFPALTICSKAQYDEEVLRKYGVQSRRSYVMNNDWVGNGEEEPWRIFEESVIPVDQIIDDLKIYLDTPTLDGQAIISLSPTGRFCEMNLFHPKEHFYFGRCHSLIIPDCLQKLGVSEIVFILNTEVDIYLHDKNDFLNPDTKAKISIALGSSAKISINNELFIRIDNCSSESNFDECMDKSLGQLLVSSLNCTVPWVGDKHKICRTQYTQTRAYQLFQENRKNQKLLCQPSCQRTNMQFGPINYDKVENDHGRAVFFFPHNVRINQEKLVYGVTSFLTDIAGLISLGGIIMFLIYKVFVMKMTKSTVTRVSTSSSVSPRVSVHSTESSRLSRDSPQNSSISPTSSAGSQRSFHE